MTEHHGNVIAKYSQESSPHPTFRRVSHREGQNFNRGVLDFIPRVLLVPTAEQEPVNRTFSDHEYSYTETNPWRCVHARTCRYTPTERRGIT